MYDNFGNATKIQVGTYTLVTYEYEENNGKLMKIIYGNGNYIENVYDELDRIIGIKINGVTKYTYAYNGNGDLYEIEYLDSSITICYNYDSLDRLVEMIQHTTKFGALKENIIMKTMVATIHMEVEYGKRSV